VATQAALARVSRGALSAGVALGADVGGASFGLGGRDGVGSVVTVSAPLRIPFGSVGAEDLRTPTSRLGLDPGVEQVGSHREHDALTVQGPKVNGRGLPAWMTDLGWRTGSASA